MFPIIENAGGFTNDILISVHCLHKTQPILQNIYQASRPMPVVEYIWPETSVRVNDLSAVLDEARSGISVRSNKRRER